MLLGSNYALGCRVRGVHLSGRASSDEAHQGQFGQLGWPCGVRQAFVSGLQCAGECRVRGVHLSGCASRDQEHQGQSGQVWWPCGVRQGFVSWLQCAGEGRVHRGYLVGAHIRGFISGVPGVTKRSAPSRYDERWGERPRHACLPLYATKRMVMVAEVSPSVPPSLERVTRSRARRDAMAVDRQDPSSRPVRPRPHCGEAPLQANGKHRPRSSEPFGLHLRVLCSLVRCSISNVMMVDTRWCRTCVPGRTVAV